MHSISEAVLTPSSIGKVTIDQDISLNSSPTRYKKGIKSDDISSLLPYKLTTLSLFYGFPCYKDIFWMYYDQKNTLPYDCVLIRNKKKRENSLRKNGISVQAMKIWIGMRKQTV